MIDIIIPAYNAHNTIERTLFSIAYQKNAEDLNVYIVNDASDKDYSETINFFKQFIKIKELKLEENVGPGQARQYGIDNSKSKYILFIDADDVFFNPFSVKTLYDNIERSKADVVISSFYEELENGDKVEHTDDHIWLHGKIYRRDFLINNNIRFNNTYSNEDNGFNQLIFLHDSKVETINNITYMWLYNEESITRANNYAYVFKGLEGYIYNIIWALDLAIKQNCDRDKIASLSFSALIAIYYYYIRFKDREDKKNLLKWARPLYDIYLRYPVETEEEKMDIWNNQYFYSTNDINTKDKVNPPISLEEFFNKINNFKDYPDKKDQMIIAMACTANWYDHMIVGLYSLLKNNKLIKKLYLLVETEDIKEIKNLNRLIEKYKVECVLINANNLFEKYINKNSPNNNSFFTNFALGKLILSDIVYENKVIYIDIDAIVIKDIYNVWKYDISNYYVAGVKDYGIYKRGNLEELGIDGKYINSGFVVFNLEKIRKDAIQKKWFDIINKKELIFPDQDALNMVCTNNELYIPSMYNVCDDVTLELDNKDLAKVFHFAGIKEDWVVNMRYAEEWYNVEEMFYTDLELGEI